MIKEITDINLINCFLKNFNTSINEIGVYSHYVGYYIDEEVVGFLNYDLIYDRSEIEYIYVNDEYRKNKIGTKLVEYLVKECKVNNVDNITLEVRKSNNNAILFYKSLGFTEVSIREGYYNGEDGILMLKEMK